MGQLMNRILWYRALFLGTICVFSAGAMSDDWPRWLGPDGLGVSAETDLPVSWSKSKNVAWKVDLPGWGRSSPIVVGDRVYLTSQSEDDALHVHCIGKAKGKILWSKQIGRGNQKANRLHNMASPTPVADANHVWVLFGTGDLACLDRDGRITWQQNIQKRYGRYHIQWGMGSSPILLDGKLFIVCMKDKGNSYLLALEADTGKKIWKKSRDFPAVGEARDSYTSPIVYRSNGSSQIVVCGAEHINAYDPKDGKQLWVSGGLEVSHPYGRSVSSPTAGEGLIIAVSSGYQHRGHVLALEAGGRGDVTKSHRIWTFDRHASDCPTPVIYRGRIYIVKDSGLVSCLELHSGEVLWQERLFRGTDVKVSPVAGDGKIYFTNSEANTVVIDAASQLKILARNPLDDETLATPALSGSAVIIRTRDAVYAMGK